MSISIEAKDFYGLPLKVGDLVISGVVHLFGKITDIYNEEGCLWIQIFNEETKKYVEKVQRAVSIYDKLYKKELNKI